ncbi:DotA/TraY family protein [Burkholderia cepacia]|uniref:DotA/TraY family protein n=1 Tax=Burkholderia cepacia TaxID=292 RepID=UPI001CF35A6B|nr:DotA/TraY family protein [Burkholderia cepacia]MCA8355516.1 DotA/TraY family protein [Burkholderia cepacia]
MIIRRIIALLFMLLLSQAAFASNLFDPSSSDVSIKVLGAIFGGLLDNGGLDPLLSGIKTFNSGVLLIGGVLAAYTIFSSVINTAHEGEVLGKAYSSAWLPIRYSLGTALVLPVIGGGYCVMQAIVMWLVVQGIGLADAVWSSFMSNPTSSANTKATMANRQAIYNTAKTAFTNSICYRSYQLAVNNAPDVLKFVTSYKYEIRETADGFEYGDSDAAIRTKGCGVVSYPQIPTNTTVKNSTPSSNSGYLGDLGTIFAPLDTSSLINAQKEQTKALVKRMDDLAGKAIEARQKAPLTAAQAQGFYAEIKTATDDYLAKIKSSADGLGNGDAFSAIKQSSTQQGWILAGAWFTRIIQMNTQIHAAVNSTPSGDRSSPFMDGAIFGDAKIYLRTADDVLSQGKDGTASDVFNTNKSNKDGGNGSSEDTSGFIKKFEAAAFEALTTVNLYELKNDERHPLVIIQDLGQRLETVSYSIMTGLAVATGLAAVFLPGAVGPLIDVMGWFLNVPIKLLMGVALGTQYVLPNMPFIIWIGAITGWVLLVIEAVIAAPLWAIMHLHPHGDGAINNRAANGYSLVLSLLLRPVLMVFGMMSALVISNVIGEFINKVYFEIFAQNTGAFSGFSAFTALGMGTLLYFIIMFIFLRKVFSITYQLPDQLLQWIGGAGTSLGQFAGDFSAASDKGGAAASAAGGAIAGSAAGTLAKASKSLKDAGGFSAWAARNKLTSEPSQGIKEAQKSAEDEQATQDTFSTVQASKAENAQQQNETIAQRTSSLPQPVQSFANKINQMKTGEDGKQSFNIKNATSSLPIIERAINDIGQDKVSIIAQDVLSKEHKSLSDDMKDFTTQVNQFKDQTK